jgi:3-dehydroquinate synthase/2-deoxy-scyllo-inosose synthase
VDERRLRIGVDELTYAHGVGCPDDVVSAILRCCGPVGGALFVVDRSAAGHAETVLSRLRDAVPTVMYPVEAAERAKTLSLVESILTVAVERRLTRDSVVVAMGGGLVANVAGLTAALLYRGVPLVQLPTTPIAAFDAVLSSKHGVNLRAGKNLCGTYLAPALIACDLDWLTTVPYRQMLTGLAEMAKNVLAVVPHREDEFVRATDDLPTDPHAALRILLDIGITAKAPFLVDDPRECAAALVFEYGHTVGHALEFHSDGLVGHGEAVAWGMITAAEISRSLGLLDEADVLRHYRLLARLRLPDRSWLRDLDPHALVTMVGADNKRGHVPCAPDEVPMVLLAGLGRPVPGPGRRPLTPVAGDAVASAWVTVTRAAVRVLA